MLAATVLLTATGLATERIRSVVRNHLRRYHGVHGVVVATAAPGGTENKWALLAQQQLLELGLRSVSLVELNEGSIGEILGADVIYVCGGNTYVLIDAGRRSGVWSLVAERIRTDHRLLYIGVSAGGLVLGPSFAIQQEIGMGQNTIGLTDLSGLGLINFVPLPHMRPAYDVAIRRYSKKSSHQVIGIPDGSGLVLRSESDNPEAL